MRPDVRARTMAAFLLLSGCATTPAVSSGVQIAPDTRPACEANCAKMGLQLAAVVLVRNSAGCVCAVPGTKPAADLRPEAAAGAVAVAGAVIIADDEDAEQRQAASPPAQQQFQLTVPVGQ